MSVHDPEMRHGRKSARRRFDGHKAAVAVDPESQLIMAADVLAGNAPDHEQALQLVQQAEANADVMVEETVGDCAYGNTETRQLFADAGRRLVAKVASRRGGTQFPKEDFRIDLEMMSCTCPPDRRCGRWCRTARVIVMVLRASLCWRFASMPPSVTYARCDPSVCGRVPAKVAW